MPIPALDEDGLLPSGVHDCTIKEVGRVFGTFQTSDQRPRLMESLMGFLLEAKACGLVRRIVVDGSFVTRKPVPNDIDLIVAVSASHDYAADLRPNEYNVVSKLRVRRRFGFDLLLARDGSDELKRYTAFFQQVRFAPEKRKGILRIRL